MSLDAVTQRWESFLGQIESRFQQIMDESLQGCLALFDQTGETLTLSNAWTGMRMRALGLRSKISDTWNDKVSEAFGDAGADAAREDAERRKGEDLEDRMEAESERIETQIYCEIARRVQLRGAAQQRGLSCSQCGAPLTLPFTLRAINVGCEACGAVNTVEPGTDARMVEGLSHHLSREAAWGEWMTARALERRWREARKPSLELLQSWEAAQIAYWRAYLGKRAELLPDRAEGFDLDLRGKMHHFYISIAQEPAWIAAGRPRRVEAPIGA